MAKRTLLLDGHVHLYPNYNLKTAFQLGIQNLRNHLKQAAVKTAGNPLTVWLLTERWDCNLFKQLAETSKKAAIGGYEIMATPEKEAILARSGKHEHLILAGRQLVSRDGLEVLALATSVTIKDRAFTTAELIQKVNAAKGVAILNWAPGKWFFKRGKIVQEIFEKFTPNEVLIGDNPLRHQFWPKPKLMQAAIAAGFKLIAGSDPLPFLKEEKYIGSYGFQVKSDFDAKHPVTSIRNLLLQPAVAAHLVGRRNNLFTFAYRETRIMLKK